MYIGKELFSAITDREAAKAAFAKAVERVEVETHSYCNRRCNYCPNVVGDRLGENKQIKPEHWRLLISDLSEINYDKHLVFQSYNEPLADPAILDRLHEARVALPKARLMTFTNGDYLDARYLSELADAGLDYMHVSIHTRYNGKYSDIESLNLISRLVRRMDVKVRFTHMKAGHYVAAHIPHDRIEIEVRAINYFEHGTDRGGLVDVVQKPPARTAPCHFPFAHFYIGFSGNITPCCHIRSDSEVHKPYIYGNLDDYASIYQAWAGQAGSAWRRELISPLPKRSPCDTCKAPFLNDDPTLLNEVHVIWERHVRNGILTSAQNA